MKYTTLMNRLMVALADARRYALVTEFAAVILIVSVLFAVAIPQYKNYILKAQKTEFYSQLFKLKNDSIVEYSVTGRWPSVNRTKDDEKNSDFYSGSSDIKLNQIIATQGNFAFTYQIMDNNKIYTDAYRLVHVDDLEPTLYWVCAYTDARADEAVRIPNITEVPIELLSHSCNTKRRAL